jgi:sialate O-acetylesterase
MKKIFVLYIIFITLTTSTFSQKTKVACIGNSVTFGSGMEKREVNSYPIQLQELLGTDYEVRNFGHSGATVLKNGHKPYWIKSEFEKSKTFKPNIVIIHLGLNDQGINNWPNYGKEFESDYLDLIATYKALPSKPKVFICKIVYL